MVEIIWTDYLKFKAELRGFNLDRIEEIVRYSSERYFDTSTESLIVVGKHAGVLVMIPHETDMESAVTPITIHATTRQQINYRVKSGRFRK